MSREHIDGIIDEYRVSKEPGEEPYRALVWLSKDKKLYEVEGDKEVAEWIDNLVLAGREKTSS
jgi:hypothetical protein